MPETLAPSAPATSPRHRATIPVLLWRAAVLLVNLGLLYMAATALVMVHAEDYFRSLFPPGLNEQNEPTGTNGMPAASLGACPVTLEKAMARAGEFTAQAHIDYVQLYVDRAGNTVWKVLTRKGADGGVTEVLVDANTARYSVTKRDGYRRERFDSDGQPAVRYTHYAKMVKGLHTGRFFGPWGPWAVTGFASLALLVSVGTIAICCRPRRVPR